MTTEQVNGHAPAFPNVAVDQTTAIVAAYVGHNAVSVDRLPGLIADVHQAVSALHRSVAVAVAPVVELRPAVPIKRSITPDAIICLEDGRPFRSLKRHLKAHYNLTPEAYREKWGLPADYPMVAPNYSAVRSTLAKENRLGHKAMN